uniref:Chorion protein n=1 Tax=Bombyx mori TaxID=7091 RepID=Q17218_BOMMO|nr:chorion protein [Bombyx mori]
MAKTVLFVFASALISQGVLSQFTGRIFSPRPGFDSLAYEGLGYGGWNGRGICGGVRDDITAAGALAASQGGGLAVVTSSAAPTGLGETLESSYEGTVSICGNAPFLGTADVAGELSTIGGGVVSYECGDGAVGITTEGGVGVAPTATIGSANIPPAVGAPVGYRGFNRGCGCGSNYAY